MVAPAVPPAGATRMSGPFSSQQLAGIIHRHGGGLWLSTGRFRPPRNARKRMSQKDQVCEFLAKEILRKLQLVSLW